MAFMYGIIGMNGAGKSVTIDRLVKQFLKKYPNATVYKHDLQSDFTHIKGKNILQEKDDNWSVEIYKKTNVLVIMDEIRALFNDGRVSKNFLKLMVVWRKKNINFIYTVHSPNLLINRLSGYTTKYFIYKNFGSKKEYKGQIDDFKVPYTASVLINNYCRHYKTKHEYKALYPKFPYFIANTETNEITGANIIPELYKKSRKN